MREVLCIGDEKIEPGVSKTFEVKLTRLFDYTEMGLPVYVNHSKHEGASLFLSAAIHGDEINGVEIIKRVINHHKIQKNLRGTLICVPIVNVYGFNNNMRYLPDRRDLNRCFPGNPNGSLGSQIANIFMNEIVANSTHGIDFHTGAIHRTNLAQIRACLDDEQTKKLAKSFNIPVIIDSKLRDGSLREAVYEMGKPMLLFEGGEALRYDEKLIKTGIKGVISVMKNIGMLPENLFKDETQKSKTFVAKSSYWVRAPISGSFRFRKKMGSAVKENEVIGEVSDPFGLKRTNVKAQQAGVIIGATQLPTVNRGDALAHIATFKESAMVEEHLEAYDDSLTNIP